MGTTSPWLAAAPFAGASQPQAGAGAAQVGAAQLGAAQLGAGAAQPQPTALPQPLLQPLLQHLLQANRRSSKQLRLQQLLQPLLQPRLQPLLQPLSQPQAGLAAQVGSMPHVGAGAAHVGAGAAQVGAAQLGAAQLGAAAAQPQPLLHPLLQPRLLQRDLQQEVWQQLVSQPQPLDPSMRSSSSKPKPWVQTARPSTNDPRSDVRFIERRLLNDGTIELAHVPVRPDHVALAAALEDRGRQRQVGPILPGSPIAGRILRGVRVRVGQVCGKAKSLSHTNAVSCT